MSSLLVKASYTKESLTDLVSDILDGKDISAPKEIVEQRRQICSSCKDKKKIAFMNFCTECGCDIEVKTAGSSFHCPKNYWLKYSKE